MSGNRNLRVDHAPDHLRPLFSAFDLHRFGAALLHKAGGITNSLFRTSMVRAIRHVGDQQGIPHAPPHRAHMVQHLVYRD